MNKNKRIIMVLSVLALVGMVVFLSTAAPVDAQTSTTLSMSPSPYFACVGENTVIYVRVTDVVNLQAYDISGTFTPANSQAISIINVENAGWLTPFMTLFPVWDNTAGLFGLAGTKLYAPGMTGDGNLIKITFQALVPNQTVYFTIDEPTEYAVLSTGAGTKIPFITPAGYDGVVYTKPAGTCNPTEVKIKYLKTNRKPYAATVSWQTVSDEEVLYFNVYRSWNKSGSPKNLLTKSPIPVILDGTLNGHRYSFIDKLLNPSKDYYYWLEAVDTSMVSKMFGPVVARKTILAYKQ